MGYIIVVGGQKGGSGKSTIALALATEWHSQGHSVLLVDTDPQGSIRTWADVAAAEDHPTPTVVAMGKGLYRPEQLPALAKNFDLVIIDCPPRHDAIQRAALMVADYVLVPSGPSTMDAWSLGESLGLVEEARQMRTSLRGAIVLNRVVSRTNIAIAAREALSESPLAILRTELSFLVAYQEAPSTGMGVSSYAPRSKAADEVRQLTAEVAAILGVE